MPSRTARVAGVSLALVALASVAWAQATVKRNVIRAIASVKGEDMYGEYCLHCHGADLTGHGPDAAGLRTPPADLTTIAARNGGKFVPGAVEDVINGWKRVPRTMREAAANQRARETGEGTENLPVMPLFGPLFAKLWPQEIQERRMRMSNLVSYIKSKQVTSPPPGDGR